MEGGAVDGRKKRLLRGMEQGAAAIEFGLIAPLLILLVFGIMSFGILFAQSLALDNAARQGARFGAVGERTCSALVTETRAAAQTLNINTANVSVKVFRGQSLGTAAEITASAPCDSTPNTPCWGSSAGDNVYVKASYQSELLIPLFFTPDSFTVGGTGGFKCEYSN